MAPTSVREKVVLVTGAGSGLGVATACAFAAAGSLIVCIDRDTDAITTLCQELSGDTVKHLALPCDVSEAEQVARAVGAAIAHFHRRDVAINCAAIDHTYWLEQLTIEQWDQIISVNLRGPFLVAKAVWPQMQQQGSGHIVNIASTSALRAASGATAYTASKSGLLGFGRALNLEGRQVNIRVTTVIPGGMRTHFFDRFAEQGIPAPDANSLQDPAHVADAILHAVQMPAGSDLQELVITPPNEPGWP